MKLDEAVARRARELGMGGYAAAQLQSYVRRYCQMQTEAVAQALARASGESDFYASPRREKLTEDARAAISAL